MFNFVSLSNDRSKNFDFRDSKHAGNRDQGEADSGDSFLSSEPETPQKPKDPKNNRNSFLDAFMAFTNTAVADAKAREESEARAKAQVCRHTLECKI